jgi:Ca2+-binding RTX toxin-like protein
MGTWVSISGGSGDVRVHGDGTVVAGAGNYTIDATGNWHINQYGSGGNDTINLGHGHDTITEAGHATIYGAFGSATIQGGTIEFAHVGGTGDGSDHDHHDHRHDHGDDRSHGSGHFLQQGDNDNWRDAKTHGSLGQNQGGDPPNHPFYEAIAASGNATLMGGDHCTQFVGGTGNVVMTGGTGNDTFVGGSGHAIMTGGSAHNVFAFTSQGIGGHDVITNFAPGQDKLYLEGQSLNYLQSHGDVTVSQGSTWISLDGGKTTIELKGFTGLSGHDVTTHKG